jgi:hypothetical protein
MDEVYICLCCLNPIIFRYRPPQVYHILKGTGWECWHQYGSCTEGLLKIPLVTLDKDAQGLKRKAEKMHKEYLLKSGKRKLIAKNFSKFVTKQLKLRRVDVICDLLVHLSEAGDSLSLKLAQDITMSGEWKRQIANLEKRKGQG